MLQGIRVSHRPLIAEETPVFMAGRVVSDGSRVVWYWCSPDRAEVIRIFDRAVQGPRYLRLARFTPFKAYRYWLSLVGATGVSPR